MSTEIPVTVHGDPSGWRIGDPAFLEGERCSCGRCDKRTHYSPRAKKAQGFLIWPDGYTAFCMSRECSGILIKAYRSVGDECRFEHGMRQDAGNGNILRYWKNPEETLRQGALPTRVERLHARKVRLRKRIAFYDGVRPTCLLNAYARASRKYAKATAKIGEPRTLS